MDKIDIFGMGWIYEAILFMLALVFFVDAFSIIRCIRCGHEEITEYAQLCVKYLKIVMCLFAAFYFLFVAVTYTEYDGATRGIHGALGVMMLIDAVVCLILKIKYRRKQEK